MGRRWSLFADDASKAYFERVTLICAPLTLLTLLIAVFSTGVHNDRYLFFSIMLCTPSIAIPVLYPCSVDAGRPYTERFWVKATVWITIFSFYSTYFWTHYFYHLFSTRYIFHAHRLNNVPILCYLITYFHLTFIFALVNLMLRLLHRTFTLLPSLVRPVFWCMSIAVVAYAIAIFETTSIRTFPLYSIADERRFVSTAPTYHALYLIVGLPMFFGIDETRGARSSLYNVIINALAATAIATLLLDLRRLSDSGAPPVPFIYQGQQSSASLSQRLRDIFTSIRVRFLSASIIQRFRLVSSLLIADYRALRNNLVR